MRPIRSPRGYSLTEVLVVLTILALTLALGMPAVAELGAQLTLKSAASALAVVLAQTRGHALVHRRDTGVKFVAAGGDLLYALYEDGNGNGVLTSEIASGVDRRIQPPRSLRHDFPGVTFSILRSVPLDPSGSPIANLNDPIRFGRSDICSFSPVGNASPGSLYLSNGKTRQAVVRVTPGTGRIQVFEWDQAGRRWIRRES